MTAIPRPASAAAGVRALTPTTALLEAEGAALFEADIDGNVLAANDLFRVALGDASVLPAQLLPHIRRVATTGVPEVTTVTLAIPERRAQFRARFVPLPSRGSGVAVIAGALTDWVDERARIAAADAALGRAEDLERAASDFGWSADRALRLTGDVEVLARIIGCTAADLVGRPLATLGRFLPRADGSMPLLAAVEQGHAIRGQDFELIDGAGNARRFRLAAEPVRDAAGELAGFRGIGVETGVRDTADVAKSDFLAAMSHELRTPLNAIIGFAEAMHLQLFGPLRDQYVDYAQDIARAGRHLLGLIEDVLDASAVEAGDVAVEIGEVDLPVVVERALAMVSLRGNAKRLTLAPFDARQSAQAKGDERRVLQILLNLLSNAVKFTPEGGSIGAEIVPAARPELVSVAVWDTGPGIADRDAERAFAKFEQLGGDALQSRPEGTGLGLHLSRELARKMGGDVTLDRQPGGGARFTLTLPRA